MIRSARMFVMAEQMIGGCNGWGQHQVEKFASTSSKIYILALKGGNFYVGRSTNPYRRIQAHQNGLGAAWTRQWGFQHVISVVDQHQIFEEDLKTKELMSRHGIAKVRGGSYAAPVLTRCQLLTLEREFDTAFVRCYRCGHPLNEIHECSPSYCYYCQGRDHRLADCPLLVKRPNKPNASASSKATSSDKASPSPPADPRIQWMPTLGAMGIGAFLTAAYGLETRMAFQ